jgi:2-dehydro-3-deoxyphosphooctonate aldolase (KDO 8-P synthase)
MNQFKLIAGPCVLESLEHSVFIASEIKPICEGLGFDYYYKSSFDKANRTKLDHYRGFNLIEAFGLFGELKAKTGVKILTDFHDPCQVESLKNVVDVLQIPAFLCRQTDMLTAAAKSGCVINIKKGQFASARDTKRMVEKITETNADAEVWLTERGTTFGYDNLVVDMRNLVLMKEYAPVIFDATHSIQMGAAGGSRGANHEFIFPLARAASAVGVDGLFLEVHQDPDNAPCDGPSMLPLNQLEKTLKTLEGINELVKRY